MKPTQPSLEVSAVAATLPGLSPEGTGTREEGSNEEEASPSWNPFSPLTKWITRCAGRSTGGQGRIQLQECEQCRLDEAQSTAKGGGEGDAPPASSPTPPTPPETTTPTPYRATLSVRGMTCAVCVNAITDELRRLDGVLDVVVSLVSNSATVTFDGARVALPQIVEGIEELGFEAAVDSVIDLGEAENRGAGEEEERTVEIKLGGIACAGCPDRVARSLAALGEGRVSITTPATVDNPIMQVRYVPSARSFTVRTILSTLSAVSPAASIYHPPTLEARSRQIRQRYQRQLLYRLALTGVICIPTFTIGIVYMTLLPASHPGKHHLMAPVASGISRAQLALLALATPVYFFAADAFHAKALREIRALWRRGGRTPILQRFYRFGSMNTLMSLGTTIAYVASVAQLIAAGVAGTGEEVRSGELYFDSVVFLTFFILLGRVIESVSKARAGDAVEMLGRLRPGSAVLVERVGEEEGGEKGDGKGGEEEKTSVITIPADLLDLGDLVRVPHGASPPGDGVLVDDNSGTFDESSLTGESRPVRKQPGDRVFAGTVNKGAPVLVRVTGVAGRSVLDRIVDAVREGQTRRAPVEQIADVLTAYFVPAITLTAVLTWLVWMALGLGGHLPDDWLDVTSGGWVAWALQFAIAVFVVACPCGLALAAPTAVFVGGGLAARHGILAKGGGEAFEKASKVDTVLFDKTGTLTLGGEPSVTDAEFYLDGDGTSWKGVLLAAVKAVEESSTHPIAKAVAAYTAIRASGIVAVSALNEIPGKGMAATCSAGDAEFELLVGSEALLADFSVGISEDVATVLGRWKTDAKSVALVAACKRKSSPGTQGPPDQPQPYSLAAAFAISDPIRPEAPAIVRALDAQGVAVWLLSGDNVLTAAAVASRVGIRADRVIAGMLPTQKAAALEQIRKGAASGNRPPVIAMVGDGVNDAPALTAADVGVAMSSGADVALGAADFVLLHVDLRGVVNLLDLSRAILGRIRVNFGWAVVYNVLAIPIAAGCLYPVTTTRDGQQHVRLDPVWASLAMALSSISVVSSSLALRSGIPGVGFRARRVGGVEGVV